MPLGCSTATWSVNHHNPIVLRLPTTSLWVPVSKKNSKCVCSHLSLFTIPTISRVTDTIKDTGKLNNGHDNASKVTNSEGMRYYYEIFMIYFIFLVSHSWFPELKQKVRQKKYALCSSHMSKKASQKPLLTYHYHCSYHFNRLPFVRVHRTILLHFVSPDSDMERGICRKPHI